MPALWFVSLMRLVHHGMLPELHRKVALLEVLPYLLDTDTVTLVLVPGVQ